MNRDAVSVRIGKGRGDDRPQHNFVEFADALKSVADLLRFDFQLMRIIDVLICAAAATPEVRAGWIDAMGRPYFKINKFGLSELLFLARDFCRNSFTLDRKRNEDGFAVFAPNAVAAKSHVLDLEIDNAHSQL